MTTQEIVLIAARIFIKLKEDLIFDAIVRRSPEPYRAMVYESGLANSVEDGSDEYILLVDTLEYLLNL